MSREQPYPMETEHGSGDGALLEAAAQRVAARLHEHFPDRAPGEHERLRRRLATLVVTLKRIAAGAGAAAVPAHTRTDEALVDRLEQELLWLPRTESDAESAVRALRACATYKNAPEARTGAPAEQDDLRSHMVGPDALELLVEVAHDFRSPLTSVLFLAETLRDGHSGEVNDLQRSQLGLMYSAAFGLATIATDVVDLARRGLDLVDEDPSPYAFADVFRNVERMVRPMVEEKGLELRVEIPEHGQAEGYPHALGRVLLNLTTNALKFTDEGFVEIGVRPLPHDRIEYYVQDTGRGIPPDRQEELFQPFKKRKGEDQSGEFFSGSGVGLSIARRLVEAMGSELDYTTSGGEGTRFSFVLHTTRRR
ncbi:MAG: HAMP domain-containing sensor histidine kinase [Gemmatimonadota bacterium]|nr:HAMP domain-containing sensor histidine kinase [Gemmatimonadota bacterium]